QSALELAEYTTVRTPDAYAINDLALQNYVEMRASVLSPTYRLRKYLEEFLSIHVPSLGWKTKYSRVSFGNERYSEVVANSERQEVMLLVGFAAIVTSPFVIAGSFLFWKNSRGPSSRIVLRPILSFLVRLFPG